MNDSFAEKLYARKTIEKMKSKVLLLGSFTNINPITFMNVRLIISFLLFFIIIITSKYAYIIAPLVSVGFYVGLEFFMIDLKIKTRSAKLESEALFFFEVLALALETGRNLKGSLELTVRNIDSELSREFGVALEATEYGKTLNEAIDDMKKRIPSETINNVLLNITHSNIFGNEIVDALYNQVDYLREKRMSEAKARIAKMPIKISIISVIFFVPIIMLVLLGPVILNVLG